MATEKQVKYCLYLLEKNGYDTKWMDATYKRLGATMNERRGSPEAWLEGKTNSEISNLISRLR